ncbi:hypothetical protein N7478_011784 [Penicillium angulare]|uniref:uncharacterized protein n=1 Tax=Penicillium angulare TaxID=116970 RepID=UPI00253FF3A6|nr:uncharacterized protein N7478_011784 [Penicillium angulare]KAJ5261189.1 hypothetical protein N7478_011784 [Penicillium angulare]
MSSQPFNSDPTVEMDRTKQPKPKRPMSHWWPVGTFCAAVTLFIIGGALAGAYYRKGHCQHNDHWNSWDDDYDDDYEDCKGPKPMLYASGALLLIALFVGLLAVILFIVWLIRRRRAQQTFYQSTPLNDYGQYPQPMYPQQYDPYAPPFAQKSPGYPPQPAPYDAPPQPQTETSQPANEQPHNNNNNNPFELHQEGHKYGAPPASYH